MLTEIAELAGVSRDMVGYAMKVYGIPVIRHFRQVFWDHDWLRQKYVDEGLTATEIGELVGKHKVQVLRALREAHIEIRKPRAIAPRGDVCARCPHFDDCLDWEDDEPCRSR